MSLKQSFLGFPQGAVAIVSGVASGIGRETAKLLLAEGVTVIGLDINEKGLAELDLGKNFYGYVLNTADQAAVEAAMPRFAKEHGPIAYLANNAGPPSALDLSVNEGLAQTAGSMQMMTAAWAALGLPKGAAVVNVASVAGVVAGGPPPAIVSSRRKGAAYNGWYAIGKSAVGGLTRYQAVFAAGAYRSNAIAPGIIDTPRIGDLTSGAYGKMAIERTPLGRLGRPEEVARALVFLLSPAASFINGVTLVIDGGGTIVY
ncbi:3-oxoacyl-[acyl-carrier protein] reductase [alpha proteobacterium U9-1i]|nr:3-oxoacyl-[acyl-carrier protein] reductase [alpha proteobacterium U9-1i]